MTGVGAQKASKERKEEAGREGEEESQCIDRKSIEKLAESVWPGGRGPLLLLWRPVVIRVYSDARSPMA